MPKRSINSGFGCRAFIMACSQHRTQLPRPTAQRAQLSRDGAILTITTCLQAFLKAAVKLKLTKPSDTAAFMKNHCLIAAILKQHMVPGRYDTASLRELTSRPSMLVTKKMVPNTKGQVTVSWPVKFQAG